MGFVNLEGGSWTPVSYCKCFGCFGSFVWISPHPFWRSSSFAAAWTSWIQDIPHTQPCLFGPYHRSEYTQFESLSAGTLAISEVSDGYEWSLHFQRQQAGFQTGFKESHLALSTPYIFYNTSEFLKCGLTLTEIRSLAVSFGLMGCYLRHQSKPTKSETKMGHPIFSLNPNHSVQTGQANFHLRREKAHSCIHFKLGELSRLIFLGWKWACLN